jgi:threonylcarbamoyladenosine tRNA methylthiotransferase MtaB
LNGSSDKPAIKVNSPDFPLCKEPYYSTRSRAFLKIQDGCNLSCSYCTVNKARGKSRSLTVENVKNSALHLEKDGYKEIILTGIHIGSYGLDLNPKSSLSEVVYKLSCACPETRFRISSLEPSEISSELLSLLTRENICNHLHIPLQSGSDKILKSMNRGYSILSFEQVINRIVKQYPHISIGTDVIAGFPGETDEDFKHTMRFIDKMPFSYLHAFPYSRRPDTRAFLMEGQVRDTVKKDRVKSLIELGKSKKNNYLKKHLGSTLNVIVEKKSSTCEYYSAISDNYLKVMVSGDKIKPGDRLDVEVKSLSVSNLIAQALD